MVGFGRWRSEYSLQLLLIINWWSIETTKFNRKTKFSKLLSQKIYKKRLNEVYLSGKCLLKHVLLNSNDNTSV